MSRYIKRKIATAIIILTILVIGIICGYITNNEIEDTRIEDTETIEKFININENESEQQLVNEYTQSTNYNKTGTLDNLEFIIDVTSFKISDSDKGTYIIVGNTASEKLYSGEIEVVTNDISGIELFKTYKFTVEPLMSMTEIPRITYIRHQEASEYDIIQLHKYREKISTYKECMLKYENMELDDIIIDSNNKYVIWTNTQISEFITFLYKKGYTDDYNLKSIVKIISLPGIIK